MDKSGHDLSQQNLASYKYLAEHYNGKDSEMASLYQERYEELRTRLERELQKSNDDLTAANDQLKAANDKIHTLQKEKEEVQAKIKTLEAEKAAEAAKYQTKIQELEERVKKMQLEQKQLPPPAIPPVAIVGPSSMGVFSKLAPAPQQTPEDNKYTQSCSIG